MTNTVTSFEPRGGDHAIDVMAFGVEFEGVLDSAAVNLCDEIYGSSQYLRETLPSREALNSVNFQVDLDQLTNGAQMQVGPTAFSGLEFKSSSSDWSVTIQANMVVATCRAYSRWAGVSHAALALLRPFVTALEQSGRPVSIIGLEYHDAWLVDRKGHIDYKQLFRDNSKRIASSLYSSESLWHQHQGWFATSADDRRQLHTLNIDVVDEGDMRRVNVVGMHKVYATDSNGSHFRPFDLSVMRTYLDELHEVNRNVLCELLNQDMLDRIGLTRAE